MIYSTAVARSSSPLFYLFTDTILNYGARDVGVETKHYGLRVQKNIYSRIIT